MIDVSHETLWHLFHGLFYLTAVRLRLPCTCWPRNKSKFDRGMKSILNDEDGPWR